MWAIPPALGLALLLSSARAVESPRTISVPPCAGRPGRQAAVEVRLSELMGVAGVDFALEFDPGLLQVESVNKTAFTEGMLLVYDQPAPGRLAVSMAAGSGLTVNGPGAVARLVFRVAAAAAEGATVPLALRMARWYDENSERHTLLADHGIFRVGVVTPTDSPLLLGLGAEPALPGMEVTLDLWVNTRHSVGKVTGEITYPAQMLAFSSFSPSHEAQDWTSLVDVDPLDGRVRFRLSGARELTGLHVARVAHCSFVVSPAATGADSPFVGLPTSSIENLEGLAFLHGARDGQACVFCAPPSLSLN